MKDTAEQKKESTKKIKAFSELHTVEPDQEKDEILSYILTDDFKEKYGPVLAYSLIHRENNKYYVPTSLGFFQITGDGDDNHVERIENPSLDHENDPVIGDVYSRLEKTEAGRPRQSNKNKLCIGDLDPYLQYIVRLDRSTMELVPSASYRNIDHLSNAVREYAARSYDLNLNDADIRSLIQKIAYARPFNSIIDRIEGFNLPEPPENPLYKILSFINFELPEGTPPSVVFDMFDRFFRKHLIKLYSTEIGWLDFPNDVVLILKGPQGIGKTLLCIAFGLGIFYSELGGTAGSINSKDTRLLIRGKLIAELSELATMRRSDNETLKSFISAAHDEYRPPYGRSVLKIPRTVSFIGTTNEEEFLTDPTGSRRYFPLKIKKINFALFKMPELFEELYAYYGKIARELLEGSEKDIRETLLSMNRLSPELETYLQTTRAEARVQSVYEGKIIDYIDTVNAGNYGALGRKDSSTFFKFYNSGECGLWIFKNPERIPRDFPKQFVAVMRENGFTNQNTRIGGRRMKYWTP